MEIPPIANQWGPPGACLTYLYGLSWLPRQSHRAYEPPQHRFWPDWMHLRELCDSGTRNTPSPECPEALSRWRCRFEDQTDPVRVGHLEM
jgi:hypothetical protein